MWYETMCPGCASPRPPGQKLCDSCERAYRECEAIEAALRQPYPCGICGAPIESCEICEACARDYPQVVCEPPDVYHWEGC